MNDDLSVQDAASCPAPLSWQEVVERILREGDHWKLERDGATLGGCTFGRGRPLYFLGGLTGTRELFYLTMWLLREEFRCVVWDTSTVAQRREVRGDSPLDVAAGDLAAVADSHGDRSLSVFATSLGGLAALHAMHTRPALVERAVILAGFARRRLSLVERLLIRLGLAARGPLRRLPFWRMIQQQNHRSWFPPFDATRWQFFLEQAGRTRIAEAARRAAVLRRADLTGVLGEIAQPVLVVRTEGDGRVARGLQEELARGLPNARTESLALCGPAAYLTHPHRTAKVVREFVFDQ